MARSAALFEPTVDSFGTLTLQPNRHRAFAAQSDKMASAEERKIRLNLMIAITFLLACLVFVAGIYITDQSIFPGSMDRAVASTGSQVDYD